MAETNKARLEKMLEIVGAVLPRYVESALREHYGDNWRRHAQFPEHAARGGKLDVQAYLRLIQNEWRNVFSTHLGHKARDAATATNAGRNAWAHATPGTDIDDDVTLRALLGGAELLEAIKASAAKDARLLANGLIERMAAKTSVANTPAASHAPTAREAQPEPRRPALTLASPLSPRVEPQQLGLSFNDGRQVGALEPWRLIAPPREDITGGKLTLDHFAANLAVVDRGEVQGAYGDPVEFFRATHMTGGLKLVLESGGRRLAYGEGPSVIGLQTNFGGGKTHTMLALLHLARADDPAALPGLGDILREGAAGLKGAKAVAFSGTDKGPDVPLEFGAGRPIRTIWGYLAWRLAGDEGLRLVAGAEEAGTSPGGEAMEKVLRAVGGPALILLDEIVAYVKQLGGERYEANLTFFQALTEAATRVPQALVVGSLPQSEDEAGGERGRETLERLEKLFGRVQSSWQAAQGAETYAIVRRRLFQELDEAGVKARDKTIEAYRRLYRENRKDFPSGVDEAAYIELMREAYPVHPLLFDQLAQEWGSLERFQRTRGVLKFIAEAARRVWLSGSNDPLIQPASIPLGDPAVRGAVIEPLDSAAWGAIIDGEVESDRAQPVLLDLEKRRFGDSRAATRAARAVFLGTAPSADARGGMASAVVRLACAQPDENVSVFGDALAELHGRSGHLYQRASSYWFGPQPTLRKLAETRARDLADADADDAIISLMKLDARSHGRFAKLHVCPLDPDEAEEGTAVALVVLHPRTPHDPRGDGSLALAAAIDALKRRSGGRLRLARNTLIFVAADSAALADARRTAKMMLAWRGIRDDRSLDLKDSQRADATEQTQQMEAALTASVRRAWSHILLPTPRGERDGEAFELDKVSLRNTGAKSVPAAVWDKVSADSSVQERLGKLTLAERLAKNWPAGEDHLPLTTIRDWFVQYVAFERLRDETVLADALSDLVADMHGAFAYASGLDADGRYVGLVLPGKSAVTVRFDGSSLLVAREAAERQAGRPPSSAPREPGGGAREGEQRGGRDEVPAPARALRRFFGSVDLDATRPIRDMQAIIDSVVAELLRTDGARVTLRLDVEAIAPDGFDPEDAAVVRDNARTLKFKVEDTGFSEE